MKSKNNIIWEAPMLVLSMGVIYKVTIEMASDDMTYIPSFTKIVRGI
jgi:hypothetical protein